MEWNEQEHPRDKDGKFTSAGASSFRQNTSYEEIEMEEKGKEIADFVKAVRNGQNYQKKITVCEISDKERVRIEELTGEKLKAKKHSLSLNELVHIEKRHGVNGRADKTMMDLKAYENIPNVLNDFDNLEFITDENGTVQTTKAYLDANGKQAKMIKYEKNIDEVSCYVVEAITDGKTKDIIIMSAYRKNKKENK